jgi:hypothetical protein
MDNKCHKLINVPMIIRYIVTTVIFIIIKKINGNIKLNINLILPIALHFLDFVDGMYFSNQPEKIKAYCYNINHYQMNDKLCDLASYALAYSMFGLDKYVLFFIIYRTIGVSLFLITKDRRWLIIFFDFIKEYLLYLYITKSKKNNKLLITLIVLKIIFEYGLHVIGKKKIENITKSLH